MLSGDPSPQPGRVEDLFHKALELGASERAAFLSRSCEGNVQLRDEVLSLIAAFEKETQFLERPLPPEIIVASEGCAKGQMLGHYRISDVIGRGGMGDVYLADDTTLGRKVALKLLPSSFSSSKSRLARFRMEAKTASSLNHPGIMTVYEIGQEQGLHYIAAEYVEGSTVRGLLAKGPLAVDKALDIALQTARALAAAHAAGIVHRDIKPENLMVRPDGYVKVLDFGLAKPAENMPVDMSRVATLPGVLLGTVDYMSPEQARGLALDARSDLFSLGAVLYEMLAGRAAFAAATPSDTLASILDREPESLMTVNPSRPPEVGKIVSRLLAKEREQRYQSAEELKGDLEELRKQLSHGASAPVPIRSQPNLLLGLVVFLLAVALAVAALWLVPTRRESPAAPSAGVTLTLRAAVSGTDGQETGNASFDASSNLRLAGNKRFRLHLTATRPGHLYLVNESSPGHGNLSEFVTLFPSPSANMGSSYLSAHQEVAVPRKSWLQVDASGEEELWLVWSREAVPQLEKLEAYAGPERNGLVTLSTDRKTVANFFSSANKDAVGHVIGAGGTIRISEPREFIVWSFKISQ